MNLLRHSAAQISHAQLNCILAKTDDHEEAAEVEWALDELVAALNARLSV